MNTKPVPHKPTPPRPQEPPRPRSSNNSSSENTATPIKHERGEHVPHETLEEGELFEQMMTASSDNVFWLGNDQPQGLSDGWRDGEKHGGNASLPPAPVEALWDSLLNPIEEHLASNEMEPMEAIVELPELGKVTVQVIPRSDGLDIALRFARESALQRCQENREASREWLSQRLGRRVRLTLDQAGH
ncbi:type III secretion system HrpP C-terminal domain-containing protein [Pseudomonas cichorii]|uniref:type III secretion system HrpP C-terminal domain-containing protein n=1 Tax=Pseudomonas cichorii TaxID=36746 RepID=UPI001C8A2F7D|nr:type III secretion system HrpP C-terminal domain-containing protein [Pseudomonas cichorii]MBX8485645.1 type III secretion system HrpP C-terminal domain-containing protein [Pseudomonas cichorii]MBX8516407.1 type III secretion system HrpP C-terminal domain-containing protein [Pseudomonas cichorii]MBX8573439.1 type III secretion system HrpP C-terminal domain-containing protein [Pseudomonas cichorii]